MNRLVRGGASLLSVLLDALKYLLETLQVIMVVPANGGTGNLKSLLDRETDTTVGDDNVPTFAECRDDRCDGRKTLRIQNSGFCTQKICNIPLEVQMGV